MQATIRTILGCSVLLALGACASIIEGSKDNVNVVTSPAMNANCNLTNERGTFTTYTPAPAIVKKSKSDLNITCNDPRSGATGTGVLASDIEAWDFGNILIGGLIGMGVDWGTGAAYNYPDSVSVPMGVAAPVALAPAVEGQPTAVATPFSAVATTQPQPAPYATAPGAQPRLIQETVPAYSSTIPAQTYYFNPARAGSAGN